MGNGNGVGHAFISITQGANTMTFGFYSGGNPASSQGIFGQHGAGMYNGSGAYTAAWDMGTISASQLNQFINLAEYYQSTDYILLLNNCSDFAISAMIIGGAITITGLVTTPDTVINLIISHATGTNGVAPATNRTCP